MNLDNIRKQVLNYTVANPKEKDQMEKEVQTIWMHMTDDFYNLCINDEELMKIREELSKMKSILSFDIKDEYSTYAYTANEELANEGEEDIYVFDKKLYLESKKISENINSIKEDINKKIDNLKSKKFAFLKDYRIEKLEKKLEEKNKIANEFNANTEKENQRRYYKENESILIEPLKKKYEKIASEYASEVVNRYLETHPIIAIKDNHLLYSNSAQSKSIDRTILNNVFNEKRKDIYKKLNNSNKR